MGNLVIALMLGISQTCPAYRAGDLEYLRAFFTSSMSLEFREMFGLTGINADEVRALGGEEDAETCRRMDVSVHLLQNEDYPKRWSGFQAGDYYVMRTWVDVPEGVTYIPRSTGMIILDREMRVVVSTR